MIDNNISFTQEFPDVLDELTEKGVIFDLVPIESVRKEKEMKSVPEYAWERTVNRCGAISALQIPEKLETPELMPVFFVGISHLCHYGADSEKTIMRILILWWFDNEK